MKSFNGQQVLSDINYQFETGKVNLIIGQSGQGKSVLAKCIVGLYEVDEGQILFDGRNFTSMERFERSQIREEIGMLFQGSALFDSLSVEQNIRFPLDMFTQMNPKEKLERVNYCLERVNLAGNNKKYPSELSGGMQKRVGIARALVLNPQYLFCDEPNSGLDPKTSLVIDELIREITVENQMTTVINTHDMSSVMEIGEKIIFLKEGLKEWEGSFKTIFKTDNKSVTDFVYSSNLCFHAQLGRDCSSCMSSSDNSTASDKYRIDS